MDKKVEKEAAFAAFDLLKADLTTLHSHASRLGDADLIAAVDQHHQHCQDTWINYLGARDWTADAAASSRSGGEEKPPSNDEPPGGGA